MPYFDDAQAVYDRVGRLLQEAVADEALGTQMQGLDAIVQLRLRSPDTQVTMGLLADGERGALLGPVEMAADLVIQMDADVFHELLTGDLNPTVALAKGRFVVKGPVAKVLKFVALLGPLGERYMAQGEAPEGDAAQPQPPDEGTAEPEAAGEAEAEPQPDAAA